MPEWSISDKTAIDFWAIRCYNAFTNWKLAGCPRGQTRTGASGNRHPNTKPGIVFAVINWNLAGQSPPLWGGWPSISEAGRGPKYLFRQPFGLPPSPKGKALALSRQYAKQQFIQSPAKADKPETEHPFSFHHPPPKKDDGWEGGSLPAKNRGD